MGWHDQAGSEWAGPASTGPKQVGPERLRIIWGL